MDDEVNELKQRIEFLIDQNKDLNDYLKKFKDDNHKKKLRIDQLENGLLELRKFIENSNADKDIKEREIYNRTIKLSYPGGF